MECCKFYLYFLIQHHKSHMHIISTVHITEKTMLTVHITKRLITVHKANKLITVHITDMTMFTTHITEHTTDKTVHSTHPWFYISTLRHHWFYISTLHITDINVHCKHHCQDCSLYKTLTLYNTCTYQWQDLSHWTHHWQECSLNTSLKRVLTEHITDNSTHWTLLCQRVLTVHVTGIIYSQYISVIEYFLNRGKQSHKRCSYSITLWNTVTSSLPTHLSFSEKSLAHIL